MLEQKLLKESKTLHFLGKKYFLCDGTTLDLMGIEKYKKVVFSGKF